MPVTPQVIVGLGLASGAGLGSPYAIFDDPSAVFDTAVWAPDELLYEVPATDLNAVACSRGSSRADGPLITYEAGQATITLVNMSGQYDPDNYQGPFAQASGWSVTCQASGSDASHFKVTAADALSIYPGDWVRFTAVAGGYLVTSVGAPSGGFAQVGITPAAPGIISSGTAARYQTMLTPQVIVRIRAVWDGVSYPLWSGHVTDWDPQYTGPAASYCVVTATDALAYLAQSGLRTELGSPAGAGELPGARVNRILDSVAWPAGSPSRDVDAGSLALAGTTLGGDPLSELQAVADAELGGFWVSAEGKAVFRDRNSISTDPVSAASQATFGSGAGELPYADRDLEHAAARLFNQVTAGPDTATAVTVTDATSVTRYQARPYSRTDLLLVNPGDWTQWAQLVLYQCKDPEQWFSALTVDPRAAPELLYPQALARDFAHRITVIRRPPGMPQVSRDCFIRGVSHEYRRGFWTTRWVLQSALKYGFLLFDTGVFDHDRLAF